MVQGPRHATITRQMKLSPIFLIVYLVVFVDAYSHHIRHYRDRFKRQQGAHLYLPGSYVLDGGDQPDAPDAGPWEEWSSPSACSRSCGGGVSTQQRFCQQSYTCEGPTKRHFSCNTQDCPDTGDFRTHQCSEFDPIPFHGVVYQWVPFTKTDKVCELNCMPKGERFYYRHKLQVTDGTRCTEESLDVCVDGKCQQVGCDMMLGSNMREDRCRVCGGDDSTCQTFNGNLDMQDLQVGYNDILLIPAGATNIRVRESAPSNNYLAIRNTNGVYYLNGNWRIDFPRTLEFAGTKFMYNRQPSAFTAPDTVFALGPTDESIFIVLLMQDKNFGVDFEYSVPKNIVTGGTNETYAWTFDQFTPCSSSCGGGTQTRNVSCAGRRSLEPADPSLCDPNNRPVEIQRCNELPCDAQWVTKQWEKCSSPCGEGGTQTRQLYCEQILTNNIASIVDDEQCATIPKPNDEQACNQGKVCADWHTSAWKPCDHICGDGKETRTVTCYRKEKTKIIALDDGDCSHEPKPETEKVCNVRPCEGLDWVTSEWSGCDVKCGLANETRRAQCATSKGNVYPDELCKGEERPETRRSCEGKSKECEHEWYASQWTECSAKCGNGVQTRKVFCAATNEDGMTKVTDDNCDASKKYDNIKECTAAVEACTGEWFSGPWSKCNKKCGGGEQTRRVICMRDDETIPATECEVDTIPSSSEECNKDPCDSDEVLPIDVTKPVDVSGGQDVATSEAESELAKSETMTTTIDLAVTTEAEYEIVEDDECDDGEWVDGDQFEEYNEKDTNTSPVPKESDATDESSSPLDASTVSDGERGSSEISLAMESLMMRDSAYSDDMQNTDLETGSGDDELTSIATESSKSSDITDEGSGDESDATDITDLSPTLDTTEVTHVTDTKQTTDATGPTEEAETDESNTASTVTETTVETSEATSNSSQTASESTDESSSIFDEVDSTTISSTDESSSSESDSTTVTSDTSTDISVSDTESTPTETTGTDSTPTETTDTDTESTSDQTSESTSETESSSSESTTELSSSTSDVTTTEDTSDVTTTEATSDVTTTEATSDVTITEASSDVTTSEATSDVSTTEASSDGTTEAANDDELFESNAGAEKVPDSAETAESTTVGDESTTVSGEDTTTSDEDSTVSGDETDVTVTTETSISTEDQGTTTEVPESSEQPDTTMSVPVESTSESGSTESTDITGTTETSEISGSTSEGSTIIEETSESSGSTSEIDIWSSTTEMDITGSTTEWDTSSMVDIFKPFLRKCKRKKQKSCKKAQYGCCYDNLTPAQGPFDKGCPMPKTCNETQFGCCEDGVSIAMGKNFKDCPSTHCEESLFGCCPDNKTPAEGNDQEGCPPPPPACLKTRWGCCNDNATVAEGPNQQDCEKQVKEDCTNSIHGCCPDGIATAEGEDFKGCDIFKDNCNESYFGCCPDGKSSAAGPNYKDCKMECTTSPFGCCDDGVTPAHGYNKEGCCLASTYGCCPDNIKSADGPSLEGCGCQYSSYGCCPDNVTSARGYNNDGCGCQYTEHGCCPDSYTPAIGPDFQGCQCYTFQFGCCPDGVSIAKGPHQQGCGCRNTEFGCCSDNQTPASGQNMAGCDCASSQNGCCLDGITEAQGPDFFGCEEIPPNLQANCVHNKDVGTCRNYTVKWYYDMEYGGCSRFWYGGCEGNDNRFKSKEDCSDVCVEPQGPEKCLLPQVTGPCEGYYPMWYYDKTRNHCTQFIYRGCLGNNNKFETREECAQACVRDDTIDACEQPKEAGPCRGQYLRWYFDQESSQCQQFYYGGCQTNHNNFPTEMSCKQQCAEQGRKKDHCSLPRAQGNCTGKEPRWYYAANEKRCMPFYYSGCEGNANSFISQEHCQSDCPNEVEKDTCQLPAETGECADYKERWYYDTKERGCRQFYWGSCGGNGNNFETDDDCKARCDKTSPPPSQPEPQEPYPEESTPDDYKPEQPEQPEQPPLHENFCFHPSDSGPCRENPEPRWFYDRDGVCKQFMYGGCEGNRNNFMTEDECKQQCSSSQELCSLPKVVGPCSGSQERFYYNGSTDTCDSFKYGGCMGNDNSFDDITSCEQRCKQGPLTVTEVPPYAQPSVPEDATAVCYAPVDTGNCSESIPAYFFDAPTQRCTTFIYSGCGGNANRYSTPEQCERQCGQFRGQDVCSLAVDMGPCDNYIIKVHFNNEERRCEQFYYGGCEGNGNRFSSMEECENICYAREEAKPNLTSNEICRLRVDKGNCEGQNLDHKRWYFDDSRGECLAFIYSGCGGNFNSFSAYEQCYQTCYEFMTPYQGGRPNEVDAELPPETSETREPEPRPEQCVEYEEECKSCPYGVKMYMDEHMCRRCACANPCEETSCPEGSQCAIDINPDYNPNVTDSYYYIPVCRQTTKPGTCPSLQSESSQCDIQCRSDADCTADLKCCVRGCSYLCLRPTESEAIPGELVTTSYQPGYTEPPYQAGYYPPQINAEEYEPEVEAREGEHAVLKCAVRGNPTPRITWRKESLLIDGTEPRYRVLVDGTLQIITLHKTDSGIYLCTADNKLGQPITNEIRLQIQDGLPSAAHVLESPDEREVLVSLGSPAELQCYALGYPFPTVTWWKDDTLLPTKTNELEVRQDYSLLVHSVQLSDLGIYTCQAYNGLGKAASWAVVVQTQGPVYSTNPDDEQFMRYVVQPPEQQQQQKTERPQYPFRPERVSPTPRQPPRQPPPYYKEPHTEAPPVVQPEETPQRTFTVPVTTDIKSSTTNFAIGSTIDLLCAVDGYPEPFVQWFKDEQPLYPADRIKITESHRLLIEKAVQSDSGYYKCEAYNAFSNAYSTTTITVTGTYIDPHCTDNEFFANCGLIVKAKYCAHHYYAKFCCKSCTEAGQLSSQDANVGYEPAAETLSNNYV